MRNSDTFCRGTHVTSAVCVRSRPHSDDDGVQMTGFSVPRRSASSAAPEETFRPSANTRRPSTVTFRALKVANAKIFSTLHPRCGTSFLLVVMIVSILVFSTVHFETFTGKFLSRIVLLPLVAGISYEIIRYSAKHPNSLLRIVTFPGLLLQKITTKEPDETQLEIAIRALEEALTV